MKRDGCSADEDKPLDPLQVSASVLAAAFGVQSSKNRERDFSRGRLHHFVIAGVTFTAVFVLAVYAVVRWVLG